MFMPRTPGYYWVRRVTHNGPSSPFVAWAYHFKANRNTRRHYRLRTIDGIIIKEDDTKELYEVSCAPISCPISDLPPSRNWIDYADGEPQNKLEE